MTQAVENLLTAKGVYFIPSGKDFLVKCLNPEHNDSNPSLRIDRVTGISHCFACGWKKNIFKHFGVLTTNSSIRVAKLKEKIQEIKLATLEVGLPDGHTPYTQVFRGISIATLKHFGAFYTNEVEKLADRIIFPITDVTGKYVAFNGRHVLSDSQPKYVIYPGGRTLPLFPNIVAEDVKTIVLVEGMFDMLNLYDKGLRNAVCCFGVTTLKSNTGDKLLAFKVQGITKIFILFDGDKAGREAAKELKPMIEEAGFVVEIISLPDDTDPGELDQESVDQIKEYTK